MNIDTIYLRSSPSIRLDLQTVYIIHTQADFHISIYIRVFNTIYTHICVCALFDGQYKTHIICCTFCTRERHRQCKQCRRGSWHFSIGRVALTERRDLTSQIRGVFNHSQPVRWGLLDSMSAVPPPSPSPSPSPFPSPSPPPDLNCKIAMFPAGSMSPAAPEQQPLDQMSPAGPEQQPLDQMSPAGPEQQPLDQMPPAGPEQQPLDQSDPTGPQLQALDCSVSRRTPPLDQSVPHRNSTASSGSDCSTAADVSSGSKCSRRTSTASMRIRVLPPGPQPQAPDQSVPRRTSTTKNLRRYTR